MRDLLLRKKKMYAAVLVVLKKWMDVWKGLPVMVENNDMLAKYVKDIEETDNSIQESKPTTVGKNQKFDEMLKLAVIICGAGTSFAHKNNDEGLAKSFDYTYSSLNKGNAEEICRRCLHIAEVADPIKAALLNHNLPEEKVSLLKSMANEAIGLIPAPHVVIKGHKSANEAQDALFHDCDQFLKNQLDKDMVTFSESQADFYHEYTVSREIGGWWKPDDKPVDDGTGDGSTDSSTGGDSGSNTGGDTTGDSGQG